MVDPTFPFRTWCGNQEGNKIIFLIQIGYILLKILESGIWHWFNISDMFGYNSVLNLNIFIDDKIQLVPECIWYPENLTARIYFSRSDKFYYQFYHIIHWNLLILSIRYSSVSLDGLIRELKLDFILLPHAYIQTIRNINLFNQHPVSNVGISKIDFFFSLLTRFNFISRITL